MLKVPLVACDDLELVNHRRSEQKSILNTQGATFPTGACGKASPFACDGLIYGEHPITELL